MARVHPDGEPHCTMGTRDSQVQGAVQQLLMEHGEYAPLEPLLARPDPDERGVELRRVLQTIHPSLLERYPAKRRRTKAHAPGPGQTQRTRSEESKKHPRAGAKARYAACSFRRPNAAAIDWPSSPHART